MGNFGASIDQRLNRSLSRFEQSSSAAGQAVRVMLPAIVQSFDPDTMTVSVLMASKELVLMNGGSTGLFLQTQQQQLPLLKDVPIQFPRGGGWNLTLPIQQGDECMVVFADTLIDVWFQNGGTNNNPISQRRHSLSDGIAVFGLSLPNTLDDYSLDSMQLRSDDGMVVIDFKNGQITITAPNVTVNATDVTVNASGNVDVAGGSVTIGTGTLIDGVGFLGHYHSNVTTGGGTSGPVVV